jgi:integrase
MGKQHKDSLGWSMQKRGNTYFVYHRYSQSGKLVGKSTGQKDHEKAIQAALEIVAKARLSLIPGSVMRGLLSGDIERDKTEQEEKLLGNELDKTNPRMTTLWTIAKRSKDDTGILHDLIKKEHSHLSAVKFRCAWKFITETLPEIHRVGDITPEHMDKVLKAKKENVNNVKKKPVSELTLAQYWGIAFRTLFKILIEQKWYHKPNPAPLVPMSNKRKKVTIVQTISDKQIKVLAPIFEDFDPAFGMFFQLGIHTGMRRTELANLRWEDIDLNHKPRAIALVRPHDADAEKGIKRSTVKTRRSERIVPLKKELIGYLKPRRRATGYVIDSAVYVISREQLQLPKALTEKAKKVCKNFHPHLMRHTFITKALMGVKKRGKELQPPIPPVKVAMWVGDSVQMILDTYTHCIPDDSIDSF